MAAKASFDPDHALAVLLQARLNKEAKKEADKVIFISCIISA